jgi:hypothetical protein
MPTHVARLLDHRNAQRRAASVLLTLCQPQRGGQTRGPGANDQDIELDALALGHGWNDMRTNSSMLAGAVC